MSTITSKNGINVDQLVGTIEAIKEDPSLGTFTFRAKSSWEDGTHSVGEIAGFTHAGSEDQSRGAPFILQGDEPPVLLGSNHGPNAVELLLQALAFCYAVGYVANAAAQGIEITRMDYEIEVWVTQSPTPRSTSRWHHMAPSIPSSCRMQSRHRLGMPVSGGSPCSSEWVERCPGAGKRKEKDNEHSLG